MGLAQARPNHYLRDPVESHAQPISIQQPLLAIYKNQPEVPGVKVLWYDEAAVKFVSPVFYKLDLRQNSQVLQSNESKKLRFDDFFTFTGLGQRILIQGRPGSGKVH